MSFDEHLSKPVIKITQVCVCVCMYVYTYVYVCVYMCLYMYTGRSKGSRTEFFTVFLATLSTGPRLNYVVETVSHKSSNWR
jgi:hypothetical protein